MSILTIDKFTYQIVRTFATDLGFSHNFELEMDNYKIIQPVVALLLGKLDKAGGDLTNVLVNFALQKADDGKSSNIERDLEEFAQQIFKEKVGPFIDGKTLTVTQCIQVKKDLYSQQKKLMLKVQLLASKSTLFFDNNSIKLLK